MNTQQNEKLPTTSDLFQKHFGNTGAVGLFHPKVESFFEELNAVCKREDEMKRQQNPSTEKDQLS